MDQGTPFDLGREAIEALERSQPDVVRLARVTSIAVRIDRAFLRQARLELLPGVPSDVEADLWFSPLVESRSAVGFVLAPEVCQVLRQELARDEALLRRAWKLRQSFHPFLTPEMRLEEEVAWLSLMEPGEEKLNEVLMRSVRAMARGGERAMGVARWALRAIPRLPERARSTEAALTLAFGTSERLEFHPMLFQGTEEAPLSPALLRSVRASQVASAVCRVGVRLHENALELAEPAPDGAYHVMELPDTQPRLLEVSWGVPVPGRKLLVAESLNVWVQLPTGVRELSLRSMEGEFHLTTGERGDQPRGEATRGRAAQVQAPEPVEATEEENRWSGWRVPSILERTVELSEEHDVLIRLTGSENVIVVDAPDGYGKSTLVRRVHASLQSTPRWRTEMASLRLRDLLINTQGFLNNLFANFPYEDWAQQKLQRDALRLAINEVVPQWKGEAGLLLAEAILAAMSESREPMDPRAWELVAFEARDSLLKWGLRAGEAGELESMLARDARASDLASTNVLGGWTGLTGQMVAQVRPKLQAAWRREMQARWSPEDFATTAKAMRDETLAIINRDGAKALEQHLEEKILPCFRGKMLVFLVEGLDSITQERAGGFVELLMGWARRKDPLWSSFRLIITATPGAQRLEGAKYVPFSGHNGFNIRELARLRDLALDADQAEYLWQLTGGCARRVVLALDALNRPGVGPYQLVWDEALRKKTNNIDWLNRFPEVLDALGSIRVRTKGVPPGLPRLLDVGILRETEDGFEVPARIYERLALYARDKVRPPGYGVDLYINAAPGPFPDLVSDFLAHLRRRVELDLDRELRVWVDRGEVGRRAQLPESWVLVNVLTQAFFESKHCKERMRSFGKLERARNAQQSLNVWVESSAGEGLDGVREEDVKIWELMNKAFERNSPAYMEALAVAVVTAAGQLSSLMLHASDAMASLQSEPDEEFSAEEGGDKQTAATNARLLDEIYGRPDPGFLVVVSPSHEVLRSQSATALLEKWFTPAELHSSGIPSVLLERMDALTRMNADERIDASRWVSFHEDAYRVVRFIEIPEHEGRHQWALVLDESPLSISLAETMKRVLTPRQIDIAGLLIRNWPHKKIADELSLSVETVKTHGRDIFNRLGVDGRGDLLLQAARLNKEGDRGNTAADAHLLEELYGRSASGCLVLELPLHEVLRSRNVTELLERWFAPSDLQPLGIPLVLLERLEKLTSLDAGSRHNASRWISIHEDSYRVVRFIEISEQEGRHQWALVLDEIPVSIPLPETMKRVLTPREIDIAGLLVRGLSNKEIADKLALSEMTVKTHVRNIFARLGVDDRADFLYQAAHLNKPA